MAEKYGVVPKRFTKAWWEYFWMYYKWHTIAAVFIILAITVTIYQKVTAPRYDLTLTYAGGYAFTEETQSSLTKELTPLIDDVNKDGEKLLYFSVLSLADSNDPQYEMAMQTKLQLALSADEAYIYILDEAQAKQLVTDSMETCVFAPLKDWYGKDLPDGVLCAGDEGVGLPLSENSLFEKLGIKSDNMYLLIRYAPRDDQKEQIAGYKAAIKLANKIADY